MTYEEFLNIPGGVLRDLETILLLKQKPQNNFEVVDTYKGCDVVRWTQSNLAEYKYFLDCRK